MRVGEISAKNSDAMVQQLVEPREIQMQLKRAPEAFLGFLFIARAHEEVQRVGMAR